MIMYRVIPDLINRIRSVHYICFGSDTCKLLSHLSQATINTHFRHSSAKSKVPELLSNFSNAEPKNIEKTSINNNNREKDGSTSRVNIAQVLEDIYSSGDKVYTNVLKPDEISKRTTETPESAADISEALLEELKSHSRNKSEEYCVNLLEDYLKSKSPPNVKEIISKMGDNKVKVSEKVQQLISMNLSEHRDHEELQNVIQILKQSNQEISMSMYDGLIYSYTASGHVDKAVEEYNRISEENNFEAKHLNVSIIRGLIRNGDEDLVKDELPGIIEKCSQFSFEDIYLVMQEILKSQHFNLLPYVAQALGEDVLVNNLPVLLAKLKENNDVNNLFNLIKTLYNTTKLSGVQLPTTIYKEFIDKLVDANHPFDDLLKNCGELREVEECKFVLEHLLFRCLSNGKFSNSLEVIYDLAEKNVPIEQHYFWPLFIQANAKFQVSGVCYLVRVMFSLGIYPNPVTLNLYVYPYIDAAFIYTYIRSMCSSTSEFQYLMEVFIFYALQTGSYRDCANVMRRTMHVSHSYSFLKEAFMKAFTTGSVTEDLVYLLSVTKAVDPCLVISKLWLNGDEERLRKTLKLFVSKKVVGRGKALIEDLISSPKVPADIKSELENLAISESATEHSTLLDSDDKQSLFELVAKLEDVEAHLFELKDKQMNVASHVFRLIKLYMKLGLYQRALLLRNDLVEILTTDVEFSPAYISCLCSMARYEGNDEYALRLYRTLREKYPRFLMDVPKATGICSLLIQNGADEELFDIIDRMPQWWGNPKSIDRKMTSFLNDVASLGDIEKSRLIFRKLYEKRLIKANPGTTAVFIETYLAMGNFEEAVRELERIIDKFHTVPYVWNLFLRLSENCEFQKMEDAMRIIMQHSPQDRTLVYWFLKALACSGEVDVLKKYYEICNVNLLDFNFRSYLSWVNFRINIETRMKALRTFILNALPHRKAALFYAQFPVNHAQIDLNREETEKLVKFLEEHDLLQTFDNKLSLIVQLMDATEKTRNRKIVVPTVTMGKY